MSQLTTIAVRNVTRNKRRSAITLIAIFLGVTVVVGLKGFMNGFLELSVRTAVEGKTGALQIHRAGYLSNLDGAPLKLSMPYSPEIVDKIKSVRGVRGVTGRIQFNGLVTNGLSQTMFAGRGLDLATEKMATPRSGTDVDPPGRALQPGDFDRALLGVELARSFNAVTSSEKATAATQHGVPPTDVLTLSSSSPEGRANSLTVTMVGATNSGFAFENKRVVTVPLALAQDLLNMKGRVTEYAVGVDDLAQLDRTIAELRAKLGPDYEVTSWTDLNPFLRDIMNRQKIVLSLIVLVLFVIVLTGIINTMLMSVFERVREIGTMLAFGVKQGQIRMLFLLEAATLGVLGGIGGAAMGRLIVFVLNRRGIPLPVAGSSTSDLMRPYLSNGFTALAVAMAGVAALLSAAYPAWKASKMNPVDALRSV